MFDVQVVHGVQEVDEEAWNCLGAGRAFTSYRWYRFAETVLADDLPIYILLYSEGEVVARATLWLRKQVLLPLSSLARGLLGAILGRWPLLVCGTPLCNESGLILPSSPLRDAALETIVQCARKLARQHRASFLVFDYLEQQALAWAGWPKDLASVSGLDPGTRLDIVWPDFETYLNELDTASRGHYRRTCRRADELGIEVTRHPAVTDVEEALALIQNVYDRHDSPSNPLIGSILENAHMVDVTWLTAEIYGRLVGCDLLLGEGDTRFRTALGLDYSVKYTYFRLSYEATRCAIEEGIRVLRGGTQAYDEKQRMGFRLEDNHYLTFTSNSSVLRWLGGKLAGN